MGVAAGIGLLGVSASSRAQPQTSVDLVELSVLVRDGKGQFIGDLEREDFVVKEGGKAVELKTFLEVSASGSTAVDEGRSMVVLLDDVTVPHPAIDSIKSIAAYLVSGSGPGDDVSVVRVNNSADEPYGDLLVALTRISEYRAGVGPYDGLRSREAFLKLIARVARRLEINGRNRKAIVCIGTQRICNIEEPLAAAPGSLRKDWVEAVSASARANASVYAVMGGRGRPAGRLVEATGGEVFGGPRDLRSEMDQIWADLSRHYLLGYWPTASERSLHSIRVEVNRKGARVVARRLRGN
jgi:VWFA-related protein